MPCARDLALAELLIDCVVCEHISNAALTVQCLNGSASTLLTSSVPPVVLSCCSLDHHSIVAETNEAMQHPKKFFKSYLTGFLPLAFMIVPPGILLNLAFAKSGIATAGRGPSYTSNLSGPCTFQRGLWLHMQGVCTFKPCTMLLHSYEAAAQRQILASCDDILGFAASATYTSDCTCCVCSPAANWLQLAPPSRAKTAAVWMMYMHNIQAWTLWMVSDCLSTSCTHGPST